ncbi:probable calcium-binding protein CML29 [Ananas comosus]|uniref:Probable calcium-binding protein CML29 n=2 Tax=Ananas comosus TaxID=4615 RepID=A0A6P5H0P3_ANACO|nr:probable calcium-binding protein CML29 [Ananas comosus]
MMASAQNPSDQSCLSLDLEALSYINSLVEAFRAFDSDSDGQITVDELRGIMASLGCEKGEREAKEMMRHWDTDRDGMLSVEEFLEANVGAEHDFGELGSLLEAAAGAPVVVSRCDEDGAVAAEEIANVMSRMAGVSIDECMDIIACLDGDGDGAITLDDIKVVAALI